MEPDCRRITKEILPAIRASIAQAMEQEHHYKQSEIAEKLDVVQVAVSKYLNKKYSKRVDEIKAYIDRKGLTKGIVGDIIGNGSREQIDSEINDLCTALSTNASI